MSAVEELCARAILLNHGSIERSGATHDVVAHYLTSALAKSGAQIGGEAEREGTGNARITKLELLAAETDSPIGTLTFGQSFRLRLHYRASKRLSDPRFGFALQSDKGERVFQTETTEINYRIPAIEGDGWFDCLVKSPNILPGLFYLEAWIIEQVNVAFADHLFRAARIEIDVDPVLQHQLTYLTYPGRGRVFMDCQWSHAEQTNEVYAAR